MIKKVLSTIIFTMIISISFFSKEANAYNDGGDGKVKINSWDINNFNSQLDLWTQNRTSYTPEKVTDRMVAGDFDGDGKDELASFYDYGNSNARIHMMSEEGGQYTYNTSWVSEPGNFYATSITGRVVAGDFDGNGKDEIMVLYYNYDTTATMYQFTLDDSTQKFSMKSVWNATGVDSNNMVSMVAGDFDGNGKDEILLFYDYENNTTGMFEIKMEVDGRLISRKAWESKSYDAKKIRGKTVAGDFNGDGKDEVAMFYDYGGGIAKIWSLNYNNNSYSATSTMDMSGFVASQIEGKVVSTNNGSKDKIIALYDYGNNKTAIFTWELQPNNKFISKKEMELSNYEGARITGRVSVGRFNGQSTRLVAMYDGSIVQSQTKVDKVISEAYKHLGKPYVWGAAGPDSFDCSGFTQYVYKVAVGIDITRTTYTQINVGTPVSYNQLKVGDLVFAYNNEHVGIYVGNGQYINAPQPGDVVKVSKITNFYAARRVL